MAESTPLNSFSYYCTREPEMQTENNLRQIVPLEFSTHFSEPMSGIRADGHTGVIYLI